MCKWIDLNDREPEYGIPVLLKSAAYSDPMYPHAPSTDIVLATWLGASTTYPSLTGSSVQWVPAYWAPLPSAPRQLHSEKQLFLDKIDPRVMNECSAIEDGLRKIAPLIDWLVMPAIESMGMAYRITATVNLNGVDIKTDMTMAKSVYLSSTIDPLRYVAHELSNYISKEIVK